MLTTKFENMRMTEYESIFEFHMRVHDLANTFHALAEQISEENLVRKILRSLPNNFSMKVTAIEEAQDISNMKVDELIGSLQTFEMAIDEKSERKKRRKVYLSCPALEMKKIKMRRILEK